MGSHRTYTLTREQDLPGDLESVFSFFADVENLELITPSWVGFRVLTRMPCEIRAGTILDYRIRLVGVPVRWRTRIMTWEPPFRFTDLQERGPYASWEHTHSFEKITDGVRMRDTICYTMPFGFVGTLAHVIAVRSSLRRIFDYRYEVLAREFGKVAGNG